MQIRNARLTDTRALTELFAALASETEFMQFDLTDGLCSSDAPVAEREKAQERELRDFIESTISPSSSVSQVSMPQVSRPQLSMQSLSVMFVIERQGTLVGFAVGVAGYVSSNPLSLGVVMGILQAQQGLGLGRQLLAALESWARLQGFAALALTVMAHNHRAVRLYQSSGFILQWTRADAFDLNGESVDELYMQKVLSA